MYTVSQKHAKCVKNSALKFSAVDKQMLENPRGIFFWLTLYIGVPTEPRSRGL